jgi:DNA-binding response OmpR family regulator
VGSQILVVEDDSRIADLIARNLEAAGFTCAMASHGDQALGEFARSRPALVGAGSGPRPGSTAWR